MSDTAATVTILNEMKWIYVVFIVEVEVNEAEMKFTVLASV